MRRALKLGLLFILAAACGAAMAQTSGGHIKPNTYGCAQGYDSLPCTIATITDVNQSTNVAGTNFYMSNAPAGKYRISCQVLATQAATGSGPSSTLPTCQAYWTDPTGQIPFANITSGVSNPAAGAFELQFPVVADVAANSTIGFQTSAYNCTSCTLPLLYKVSVTLERVQ